MNSMRLALCTVTSALALCGVSNITFAQAGGNNADTAGTNAAKVDQAKGAATPSFASDNNNYSGDHLRIYTPVRGFRESDFDNAPEKCAPRDSSFKVLHDDGTTLIVRFIDIAPLKKEDEVGSLLAKQCGEDTLVVLGTPYAIRKDRLQKYEFKRSGITFGGLVIPFKVRMGGDNAISASSTVAPYIGFNSRHLQFLGLSLSPIVTAGVAFVPIPNDTGTGTDSKAAFSYGVGLVLKSSKNDQFTAGLVIGQDLVSDADLARDQNARKPWISFYLGVAM